MRAAIRRFHSPDVDLNSYVPVDPAHVGVLVQLMIGAVGAPGEESFDVVVCTPRWLGEQVRADGPTPGRGYLVVEEWDFPRIRAYLQKLVGDLDAPTWGELAARIGRVAHWEFEDYQPF